MYTLRSFDSEGVESNLSLGNSYSVIYRNISYELFRKVYKDVFGVDHFADLDEKSNLVSKSCQGFILDSFNKYHCLYKSDTMYIVSSNGKTFSKLIL